MHVYLKLLCFFVDCMVLCFVVVVVILIVLAVLSMYLCI